MRLYQVDAFIHKVFKGNPAGVWVGEKFPPTNMMQAIAAEMNLSETAFVERGKTGYRIRYFTPAREVPLCGHATLASAHILHELGEITDGVPFILEAAEQNLSISVDSGWIAMEFPVYRLLAIEDPRYLEPLVGARVVEAFKSENNWIVARLADENILYSATPDFQAIQKSDAAALIAATTTSSLPEYDYSVRVFCNPAYGIEEDPVTGVAQCVLAPYWQAELKKNTFFSRQISKRGGEMKVTMLADTVKITGQAVTVFTLETRF